MTANERVPVADGQSLANSFASGLVTDLTSVQGSEANRTYFTPANRVNTTAFCQLKRQ